MEQVLEGTTFHITACSAGFFVNSTRNDHFNPSPALYAYHSNTLLELLNKASPKFHKNFEVLLHKASESCQQDSQVRVGLGAGQPGEGRAWGRTAR